MSGDGISYKRVDNEVFRQLCEKILNRDCIPFLGSGVSIVAKYIGDDLDYKDNSAHTVDGLKKLIASSIGQYTDCPICKGYHEFIKSSGDEIKIKEFHLRHTTLGEICERFLWEKNGTPSDALKDLVTTLKIVEFSNLDPTFAHYYIAFLVREGLIPKIFTTNYDTCLEKAFLQCLGIAEKPREQEYLSVVHDNITCMNQKVGKQGTGEQIHIFKFNGCATELEKEKEKEKSASNGEYYENILLTMTQLQNWRERRWAEDTFRVALRSNTIAFTGFGSDEPQIIHTIQQILDEYSSHKSKRPDPFDSQKLPANAPVIHIYEETPLFCQLQIVNNYVRAISGSFNQNEAEKLILNYESLYHETGRKLPADDFWRQIYQEIQFRLIKKILENGLNGQLTISVFPNSKQFFSEILKDWESKDFGLRSLLIVSDTSEGANLLNSQTIIGQCISQILSDGRLYHPLVQNQSLIAEFLFLLWAVNFSTNTTIHFLDDKSIGNLLEVADNENQPFFILSKRHFDRYQERKTPTSNHVRTAFCLNSDNFHVKHGSKDSRITFKSEKTRTRDYLRILVFSVSDLQTGVHSESNETDYKKILKDRIMSPSKYHARSRKTKRTHYGEKVVV
ncbi:SIR2 family protein [Leptospira meyeri]|uniref:SIR2 family protein n=1 Tax=Leptospira meyeri TaxID=29508 RepID=UPI000C29A874|nr:SIR2 family protein [Leptospira meyeri]PJZ79870.1 hypothetical protein CH359_15160 [Leptospira meyeri]PJZ96170.1 hypothetical protein CH358_14750 [Leptospira meyeri]